MNNYDNNIIAQDLSKNMFKTPEIYDIDAINANIDNLLNTGIGERFFNIPRGTLLKYKLFEIDDAELSTVLDDIAAKLKRYVPQIIVLEKQMNLTFTDSETVYLTVPYIVKLYYTNHKYQTVIRKR